MKFEILNLDGLNVVLSNIDSTSITVQVLAKAGSINETKNINGISHFLEHMFFKGGRKYINPQAVSEAIDEVGGSFNGYTSYEYAGYYVKCASKYTQRAMDFLLDILIYPRFDEKELEKEKQVVLQELKMIEDDPSRNVAYLFFKFYYGDNPYGWPVIGTEENILSFTREQLVNYKNSLYTKDNLVISVAGNFKKDEILNLIKTYFSDFPDKRQISEPDINLQLPDKYEDFLEKGTQQVHFMMGLPGFTIHDSRRYIGLVLSTILGGKMSSILFQELREKLGLCYYVSSYLASGDKTGLFVIKAGLDKKKFEEGKEALHKLLDKLVQTGFTKEQFEKAKKYLIGRTLMGLETSDELADYGADQYLFRKRIISVQEAVKNIENVSFEQVNEMLKERFKAENRYSYWIC